MAQDSRDLLSVGIDVGTATTQVVLSRLTIRGAARTGSVPRLHVDSVVRMGPIQL
jgi:ethanolamine utilization protein EutA